jgi:hypothetical protein
LELNIAFAAMGILIIINTLWGLRKLEAYSRFMGSIAHKYDVKNVDFSGKTKYTDCISHEWIIDNSVRKKHSRLGLMFQEHLFNNTLAAALWVGYAIGIGYAVILALIFTRSIETVGLSIVVFVFGFFILLGPGSVKVSDELLDELMKHKVEELCVADYVYAAISFSTIKNWLIKSGILGIVVLIVSPYADLIPTGLAAAVSIFTVFVVWNPGLFLAQIWYPLALIYMAGILPAIFVIIWTVLSKFRAEEVERVESSIQW